MSNFIERMENELIDLNDRIGSLCKFIEHNPMFSDMPGTARELMARQLQEMRAYSSTLSSRVDYETKDTKNV